MFSLFKCWNIFYLSDPDMVRLTTPCPWWVKHNKMVESEDSLDSAKSEKIFNHKNFWFMISCAFASNVVKRRILKIWANYQPSSFTEKVVSFYWINCIRHQLHFEMFKIFMKAAAESISMTHGNSPWWEYCRFLDCKLLEWCPPGWEVVGLLLFETQKFLHSELQHKAHC